MYMDIQEANLKSGIYKINFPNGKCYIGLSNNIGRRIKEHNNSAFGKCVDSNLPVHQAIKKYGKINKIEILFLQLSYNREELIQQEKFWIKFYHSYDKSFGYNLTLGGDGAQIGVYNSSAKLNQEQLDDIYYQLQFNLDKYIFEIAKEYNISAEAISDINNGNRYFNKNLKYPLRNIRHMPIVNSGTKHHLAKLNQKQLDEILNLLENTTIPLDKIAQMYNIGHVTISDINQGKRYFNEFKNYPIRKKIATRRSLNDQQVYEIIQLLKYSNKTIIQIAKDFNVSSDTIRRINKGHTYIQNNEKYPLRK